MVPPTGIAPVSPRLQRSANLSQLKWHQNGLPHFVCVILRYSGRILFLRTLVDPDGVEPSRLLYKNWHVDRTIWIQFTLLPIINLADTTGAAPAWYTLTMCWTC